MFASGILIKPVINLFHCLFVCCCLFVCLFMGLFVGFLFCFFLFVCCFLKAESGAILSSGTEFVWRAVSLRSIPVNSLHCASCPFKDWWNKGRDV